MKNNIVPITENSDICKGLIGIIEKIKSGEIKTTNCTLVINTHVYHFGDVGNLGATKNAVFNLNLGLQRTLEIALDDADDQQ